MDRDFGLSAVKMQMLSSAQELRDCNEFTVRYGLCLNEEQIRSLVERRFGALRDTGRIEFGEGILKKLILAFCDSPFLTQENYEDTILELQDWFYYFKNESEERISDDELIEFMKNIFNGKAQGSLEYLSGTSLEDLCRNTRYGYEIDDTDRYGRPF
jgi:hypothetical protein